LFNLSLDIFYTFLKTLISHQRIAEKYPDIAAPAYWSVSTGGVYINHWGWRPKAAVGLRRSVAGSLDD